MRQSRPMTVDIASFLLGSFAFIFGWYLRGRWDARRRRRKWGRKEQALTALGIPVHEIVVPADLEGLTRQVARATCGGVAPTNQNWIGPTKFERPDWQAIRAEIIARGLWTWKDEAWHNTGLRVRSWRGLYWLGHQAPPPEDWQPPAQLV